jgi:hypothetical protein
MPTKIYKHFEIIIPPQCNPQKIFFILFIFKVLRNIIKILLLFYSTSYAEMGPAAARARLAASHVPPGPCADRAFFALANQARTASSG